MNFIIPDAHHPGSTLATATVHRVIITKDNTLVFREDLLEGKDYKLVKMSPDLVLLGENVNGEIVFEDALELITVGHDARTIEALRKHRMDKGKLVVLMSPLKMRKPLPIPEGAHKAFWAYTL